MFRVKLFLITIVISIFVPAWAGTSFDYPSVTKDVSDISFYRPCEESTNLPTSRTRYVRNVILLIGDGMGFNHVALARARAAGLDGRLYMERMPVIGLAKTHSADATVTDSAASGTAIACGIKTNNGMLGMTPDKTEYTNVREELYLKGFRTGLVVTSTITHATPASFAAHIDYRNKETQIAAQTLKANIDVLFGGGKKYWLPKSVDGGAREDGLNLIEQAKKKGYVFIDSAGQMAGIKEGPVLGLFAEDGMTTFEPEPMLAEMTVAAIKILSKKSDEWFAPEPRFFLMVEGSQIDWACHDNNADNCVKQTLLFDLAVKEALDFAVKDKQTLVIVTADHETGGLTLDERKKNGRWPVEVRWATKNHSGAQVPIFAFGPGAEDFAENMDNTEIPKIITRLTGIKDFPRVRQQKYQTAK